MNKILAQTLIATAGIVRGTLASAFSYLNTLIKSGTNSAMQFHQEGIAFAREMGMNAKEAQAYTEVLTDRTEKLAMKYGVAAEQVKELQRNISIATSRQLMLNDSQAEGFLQLNKLVGSSTVAKFTEEMVNGMGGQLDTVQGAVSKAYATAAKSGLNAQKVSEKIANNLSMANKLSFRTGIDGLTRMAMQAEKVGMSLQTVESVANNFMEIDSAIEHSAMLNMLGGAAGIFGGNPLDMAYEANNDPEALQKRITSALGGLASFDPTKGIASMNGLNMDFARNIAKALGMNPDEAVRVAKKQAEVGFKERNISSNVMAGLTQEQRDFLINKSNVANGKTTYTANVNGKAQTFDLTKDVVPKEVLEEMMKYEGMSDRDIMEENARSLTSINEILTGIKTSITAMFAKFIEGMFPQFQGDLKKFGELAKQKLLPVAQEFGKSAREIYNWIKGNKGILKTIASGIVKVSKWLIEYWPVTLGVIIGNKVLSLGNTLFGGKLGTRAASGAANGITNIASRLHQGSAHQLFQQRYTNHASRGITFGQAARSTWRATSKLAKGTALLGLGTSVMEGLGAQGKYNDTVNEINNSNMSQAEKTKALEQARIDRNSEVGGAVGQGVGSVLGTFFFGPLGGMIGGAVGKFAGEFIGKYWDPIWNGIIGLFKTLGSAIGSALKFIIDNNPIAWMARGIGKLFGKDWSPSKIFGDLFSSGEKHAEGGVIGGSSYSGDKVPVLANSGEAVITPQQFNAVFGETPVKPKKSLGEAEYVYKPNRTETSNVNGNTITVKDFNINLSGTLKLDGGGSSKNIDVNELLRDQAFMTSLKNMIKTSINQDINGGRYMNDLATMSGFPSQTSIYAKH